MKRLGFLVALFVLFVSISLAYANPYVNLTNDPYSSDYDLNYSNLVGNTHNANYVLVNISGVGETTLQKALNRNVTGPFRPNATGSTSIAYTLGYVGIGTNSPNTTLDVVGGVKIGYATACSAATQGSIRYNYTSYSLEYCNSSIWTGISTSTGAAVAPPIIILDDSNHVEVEKYVNAQGFCLSGDCRTAWNQIGGGSGGAGSSNVTGTFSGGYIIRAFNGSALVNSNLYQNGNNIGIGITTASELLSVVGNISSTTDAYFATSSGKVGIGTTTPSQQVHVYGSAPQLALDSNSGTAPLIQFKLNNSAQGYIGVAGTANNLLTGTVTGDMVLRTVGKSFYITLNGATSQFAIDTTGNVGIGTLTPQAKLHVLGVAGITSFTGSTSLGVIVDGSTSTNDYSGIDFRNSAHAIPKARIGAFFSGSGSYLQFGTSNSYATGITNTAMTIDYAGRVGIGTVPNSQFALDIQSTADTQLHLYSGPGDVYAGIKFEDGTASDSIMYRGSTNAFTIGAAGTSTEKLGVLGNFSTTGGAYLATSSGNVGIGDTNPGQKLSVTGNIAATGSITAGGNTVLHAGNYNSYSPTLTGTGASGTWGISVTGNAATATNVAWSGVTGKPTTVSGYGITDFVSSGSATPINPDSVTTNGLYYATSVSLFGQTDGALFAQAYNSAWIGEIFQDYRTGQLAVRGKNNNAWQSWRTILDSSNYNSYSPTLTGTGASGTWGISVSGNAATATTASAVNFNGGLTTGSSPTFAGITVGSSYISSSNIYGGGSWIISAGDVRSRAGYYYLGGSDWNAIQGTDTWLRLNNNAQFTSGVYTPGLMRADGGFSIGGYTISAPQTTYGTIALTAAKNGYYGLLIGTSTAFPNYMYDGAGNGGIYVENYGWVTYMQASNKHTNYGTSADLGYTLGVNGNIGASAFYYTSDARLKKNIAPLNDADALSKVLQLKPVSFNWINSSEMTGTQLGFIAQDVEKLFPEVVNTAPATGMKSVEYANLISPTVAAIQEQQKIIDAQAKKLDAQQSQIDALTKRLDALEARR